MTDKMTLLPLYLNQIKHKILHKTPLKRPVPNNRTGLFNVLHVLLIRGYFTVNALLTSVRVCTESFAITR